MQFLVKLHDSVGRGQAFAPVVPFAIAAVGGSSRPDLGIWPISYCCAHWNRCRLPPLYTSPLVANTAKTAQNRQTYKNACLFSRRSLRFAGSSQFYPLASLAHSCPSVPDGQPTGAEMRDSGKSAGI